MPKNKKTKAAPPPPPLPALLTMEEIERIDQDGLATIRSQNPDSDLEGRLIATARHAIKQDRVDFIQRVTIKPAEETLKHIGRRLHEIADCLINEDRNHSFHAGEVAHLTLQAERIIAEIRATKAAIELLQTQTR